MDIGTFDVVAAAEKPQLMDLLGPHGKRLMEPPQEKGHKPKPIRLPVLSFDNEAVLQAGRDFDREMAKHRETMLDHDYNRQRKAAVAAAAVPEWPENLTLNGTPITKANARDIMSSRSFSWLADQILMFGGNRGNYFRDVPQD